MVKKMAGGVLRGQISLISMTLPVGLFEPRSHLERIVDCWVLAPYYLSNAGDLDPLEQMKRTMAFAVSGLEYNVAQVKPFNPVIGETYEAAFADGTQIFCEQFAHHPPVSGYEMFGPNNSYHLHGAGEWHASFSGNSVKGHQTGRSVISFRNGTTLAITWPHISIRGLIYGDRIIEFEKEAIFEDVTNGLTGVIYFNPDATGLLGSIGGWFSSKKKIPSDYFRGGIYTGPIDPENPALNRVAEVSGTWLGWLDFDDGDRYWDIRDPHLKPFRPLPVPYPLPSDCRYRLDIVNLKEGNSDGAQAAKHELEEAQRADAKLRKAGAKARSSQR